MKKHEELWIKTRFLMRSITKNPDDYDEKYIKIKFNLYNELPPNKTIKITSMTMVVSTFFMKTANIIHKIFETNVCIKNKMKSKIDTKNCTCFYFDDMCKDRNIYSVDILLDKKSYETYENILVYNILYKTSTSPRQLCIRFNKLDGFIRVLDGEIKDLVLFGYVLFDKTSDIIKYLTSKKLILQIVLIIILEK